jgi:hypothetical protein
MAIEVSKRLSVFSSLKDYCHHADKDSFIEATEWTNGEGYDINISSSSRQSNFFITHGERQLLQVLINFKQTT